MYAACRAAKFLLSTATAAQLHLLAVDEREQRCISVSSSSTKHVHASSKLYNRRSSCIATGWSGGVQVVEITLSTPADRLELEKVRCASPPTTHTQFNPKLRSICRWTTWSFIKATILLPPPSSCSRVIATAVLAPHRSLARSSRRCDHPGFPTSHHITGRHFRGYPHTQHTCQILISCHLIILRTTVLHRHYSLLQTSHHHHLYPPSEHIFNRPRSARPCSHQHAFMSLVQRVTSIDGTDREPPQLDSLFQQGGYSTPGFHGVSGYASNNYGTIAQTPPFSLRHKPSNQRSLRHVLSYDALPKPEEPSQATNPTGGVTAYKVPTGRRFGTCNI